MKDYTKDELDKKIESFLTKKFQKYPDIIKSESKHSKRLIRERRGIMQPFIVTQLKMQF